MRTTEAQLAAQGRPASFPQGTARGDRPEAPRPWEAGNGRRAGREGSGASRDEQRLQALAIANRARSAAAQVKRDVRAGRLTLQAALGEPAAGAIPIGALIACQRRWNTARTARLCLAARVSETRRVRELTERQRAEILRLAGQAR